MRFVERKSLYSPKHVCFANIYSQREPSLEGHNITPFLTKTSNSEIRIAQQGVLNRLFRALIFQIFKNAFRTSHVPNTYIREKR